MVLTECELGNERQSKCATWLLIACVSNNHLWSRYRLGGTAPVGSNVGDITRSRWVVALEAEPWHRHGRRYRSRSGRYRSTGWLQHPRLELIWWRIQWWIRSGLKECTGVWWWKSIGAQRWSGDESTNSSIVVVRIRGVLRRSNQLCMSGV
jgi:hypothetical protein